MSCHSSGRDKADTGQESEEGNRKRRVTGWGEPRRGNSRGQKSAEGRGEIMVWRKERGEFRKVGVTSFKAAFKSNFGCLTWTNLPSRRSRDFPPLAKNPLLPSSLPISKQDTISPMLSSVSTP